MLRHRPSVLLALGLLWLAGCAGSRPPGAARPEMPDAFPHHSFSEIRAHLLDGADDLRTFTARASLTVQSPLQSGRATAKIYARRDDSLYLSLSPGLGIEAARTLVTPDSFFVYDRIEKQLYYGALRDAGDFLPGPVGAMDLFANLLGILAPDPDVHWTVEADTAMYTLRDASGRRTYTIDPAFWRVVHYRELALNGEVIEERRFSEFDRFDGAYLPRRLVFRRPLDDTYASLYYRDLDLSPDFLLLHLRIDGSVERIHVDDQRFFSR